MKALVNQVKEKMAIWGLRTQLKIQEELKITMQEERGDIGIKQLAITVGVIVVVGAAVVAFKDNIGTLLEEVWDWLFETIQDMVG